MRVFFLSITLIILCMANAARGQNGIWAGTELLTDHAKNNGLNFYVGYFTKKEKTFYFAPYFQLGYMPKMTFDDSTYKYISMEPGGSAVLQFDAFKLKLGVATVRYIPLDLMAFFSGGKSMLIPTLSFGTGEKLLGNFDINIYYGHSLTFGGPAIVNFKLSEPYTKAGLNVGVSF